MFAVEYSKPSTNTIASYNAYRKFIAKNQMQIVADILFKFFEQMKGIVFQLISDILLFTFSLGAHIASLISRSILKAYHELITSIYGNHSKETHSKKICQVKSIFYIFEQHWNQRDH